MRNRDRAPNNTTASPSPDAQRWEREYRTQIDGLETFARTIGEGRDVVLIHGAGISSAYWIPAQRALAAIGGFRVHAFDLPGFGHSETPPWRPDLQRLVRHSIRWVEQQISGPVHLVGQSLGCEVALGVAAALRDRTQSLVLAGPAGLPELRSFSRQLFEALIDAPREPLSLYGVLVPAYLRCGPTRLFQVLLEQKRHPCRHLLETLAHPMLIVRGEWDPIASQQRVNRIADLAPHARIATIPGAHASHYSHPEAFAAVVSRFLQEVESGPPDAEAIAASETTR